MSWKTPGNNKANIPRNLTDTEIKSITDRLKDSILCNDQVSKKYIIEKYTKTLNFKLRNIKISPLQIKTLGDQIISQLNDSLVQGGTSVGILAGEAHAAQGTQATLSAFHSSGTSQNVSVVDQMIEQLTVKKVPKFPITEIILYPTDGKKVTYEEALNTRTYIPYVEASRFVKEFLIGNFGGKNVPREYWHNWHDMKDLNGKKVLRIFLDTLELQKYKITMDDYKKALLRDYDSSVDRSCTGKTSKLPINVIASPFTKGIIDIYLTVTIEPMENDIRNNSDIQRTYFIECIIGSLGDFKIKGINDIKDITPEKIPYTQYFKIRDGHLCISPKAKLEGLSYDQYRELLDLPDYPDMFPDKIKLNPLFSDFVSIKRGELVISPMLPVDITKYLVKLNLPKPNNKGIIKVGKDYDPKSLDEPIFEKNPLNNDTDLGEKLGKHEHIKILALGNNLYDLFKLHNIDPTKTISNNVLEVFQVFGIEIARAVLIKEISEIIYVRSGNSYIHPTHIVLMADFLTAKGKPFGLTDIGLSNHSHGPLSLASISKTVPVMIKAAMTNNKESLNNTSAAIVANSGIVLGTGSIDVGYHNNGARYYNDDIIDVVAPSTDTFEIEFNRSIHKTEVRPEPILVIDNIKITKSSKISENTIIPLLDTFNIVASSETVSDEIKDFLLNLIE